MALIINVAPHCNTVDFLCNKEKTPPKLKIDSKKVAKVYDDIGIVILKPCIDRIVWGFSPTKELLAACGTVGDLEQEVADLKEYIASSLFHAAKMKADGLECVEGVNFNSAPYKHYNMNFRYTPAGSGESIFIQVKPKKDHHMFMRFDVNCSKISPQAMAKFRSLIEESLVIAGVIIPYEEFIAWSHIFEIEAAIDILGARPAELEMNLIKGGKPFPCKNSAYKSKTGRVETLYLNVKKGQSSRAYVYDKQTEQLDAGKEPLYGNALHSRYEWRFKKTREHKLLNVQNPCNKISIRAVDYKKLRKRGYVQKMFIGFVLSRTYEKAIDLIPAKYQPKYKAVYEECFRDIWDAKLIWSYWPDTLQSCGLFPALKCTKNQT